MKILHIIRSINPDSGGVIESIILRNILYKELKFKCEIATLDIFSKKLLLDKRLPFVNFLGISKNQIINYFNFSKWLNINIKNYDLIIYDGIWQITNFALWKIAKENNVKYHIVIHGMLDPWFNKKILKYLKKLIFWWLIQYRVLRDAKSVIFTSNEEARLASKASFFPYKIKNNIISHPVQGNPYIDKIKNNSFLKKFPKLKKKRILLYLGRIHEKKGLDILLKAFKKFSYNKEIHLVISGPHQKEYISKIKKLIDILDLKNHVTFTGPLYNKIKWDAYYASEFFCLPTHQENFGLTLAEAMSSRRPVITTNKTNIWKYIKDYKAGFLGDDNVVSLQKNIQKWLSLNKKDYDVMCINAFKCFNQKFSKEAVKKDFNKILNQ